MAIATYSDLKSAVAAWLERDDLTDRIPDFITLCESRLNRKFGARTMQSDVSLAATPGSRFIGLPAAFREPMNLWLERSNGRDERRLVSADQLGVRTTAGEPQLWAIDGANIAFECPCDQAYGFTLRMLGSLALSDDTPTNLLLANYPDLYLFGALVEAGPFLRDAELLATFEARFQAALEEAQNKEDDAEGRPPMRTDWPQLQRRTGFDIRVGY